MSKKVQKDSKFSRYATYFFRSISLLMVPISAFVPSGLALSTGSHPAPLVSSKIFSFYHQKYDESPEYPKLIASTNDLTSICIVKSEKD